MTHADGTQDEELYGAMRSAIGAEPPMAAQPYDDLARGRRRLLHRRVGTALAAVAVVPAVALVATVVPGSPSAGPVTPDFVGLPSASNQTPGQGTLDAECAVGSFGDSLAAGDSKECPTVPGTMDTVGTDHLEAALGDVLDPNGTHIDNLAGGVMGNGHGTPVAWATVSGAWREGDASGSVWLSVVDPRVNDVTNSVTPCEDPGTAAGGPTLTCERRKLADGSTVLVGTGRLDGFERITVRFDRPDGQVVWTTADQAEWLMSGAAMMPALDAPPATVDQLIELAQDDRAHL